MNRTFFVNIGRFVLLIILQVVLFDNIHLYGVATPYPYILFILLYPPNANKKIFYISCFLLGLIVDIFNNSGGVNALASLSLAGVKEAFLKSSFGISYEQQNIKIAEKINSELITYLVLSIIFHHLILYSFEIFSIYLFTEIIIKALSSSVLTFICLLIIIGLSKPTKR